MAKTNIEKLMELKKLYETGVLTKEEMEAEKAKILGNDAGESPRKEQNKEDGHSESVQSQQISQNDADTVDNEESFIAKYKFYIFGVLAVLAVVLLYVVFSGEKDNKPLYPDGHPIEATDTLVLENLAEKDQEEEIDIFKDRLPINELLKVKDDRNSARLKRLLIENGFTCKPDEEYDEDDYNSYPWEKTVGNGTEKDTIMIYWDAYRRNDIAISMLCSNVKLKDKWFEELVNLGYTSREVRVDESIYWEFKKGETEGGLIYEPNPGETKYTYMIRTSFE